MARKSDKLEALCQVRKEELIADIMRGELSWRALSSKYDVPEATLRSFADRSQIQRNPTGAKREMVAAKMASLSHGGNRKSNQDANLHLDTPTSAQAAKLMNVSLRQVAAASRQQAGLPKRLSARYFLRHPSSVEVLEMASPQKIRIDPQILCAGISPRRTPRATAS